MFEITNLKQITMSQILNSKQINDSVSQNEKDAWIRCFGHWKLRFGIYLEFGACYLIF